MTSQRNVDPQGRGASMAFYFEGKAGQGREYDAGIRVF